MFFRFMRVPGYRSVITFGTLNSFTLRPASELPVRGATRSSRTACLTLVTTWASVRFQTVQFIQLFNVLDDSAELFSEFLFFVVRNFQHRQFCDILDIGFANFHV